MLTSAADYRVERLDHRHCHPDRIRELATVYKHVFSYDPQWQECYICPCCHKIYPPTTPVNFCVACDCRPPLIDFWTEEKILDEFYQEMSLPNAACFVATSQIDGRIIGFCWGFFHDAVGLAGHLDIAQPEVEDALKRFNHHGAYAYQDEIAVLPDFQKKGIGKGLLIARHEHFKAIDPDGIALFRTLRTPPSATYSWLVGKLGYEVVYTYSNHTDPRDRIIAALPINVALERITA